MHRQSPGTCGGGLAQGSHRCSVTPRQWLDQRWQRQAARSSDCHKLAAAAVDAPLATTHSFLATQNNSSSLHSTSQWDGFVVSAVPEQLLVARPAVPSAPSQQQLTGLVKRNRQGQKQQQRRRNDQQQQQQEQPVNQHAAGAYIGSEAQRHSPSGEVHGRTNASASSGSSSSTSTSTSTSSSSSSSSSIAQSQQLMADIKAAKHISQLQQLYSSSSRSMDLLHCTCMLNRLAHAWERTQRKARAATTSSSSSGGQISQSKAAAAAGASVADHGIAGHMVSFAAGQGYSSLQQAQGQLQPANSGLTEQQQQQQQARLMQEYQQLPGKGAAAVRLLEALLTDLQQQHLAACSPRQLSSCMWAIGKFSRAVPGSAALQQAATALLGQLLAPAAAPAAAAAHSVRLGGRSLGHAAAVVPQQEVEPSSRSMQCSQSGNGGAMTLQQQLAGQQTHWLEQQQQQQLQQQQQQQQQQLQQQQQQQQQQLLVLDGANMFDLGNTLWALGRLAQVIPKHTLLPQQQQQQQQQALLLLEQACCRQLQPTSRCNGRFLASCLYGFAHLGHPVPALFSALVSRAGFNYCQQLQSQHVVIASWALAKLGHYDAALTARLLWRAVVVRQALHTHGVGLLLWSAGKLGHSADPRAVAQLLHAFKQNAGKARGKDVSLVLYGLHQLGLLQQHRAWLLGRLLQLVLQRLQDMQPAGIATLLSALLELSRSDAAAADAQQQAAVAAAGRVLTPFSAAATGVQNLHSSAGQGLAHVQASVLLSKRLQQPSSSAAAAAAAGEHAARAASSRSVQSSSRLLDPRHMAPLYREVARRIAAQLQHTKPQTLASISLSLAGLGYYDARLYSRLAAALAAATGSATSSEQLVQQHFIACAGTQGQQQQQQGEERQQLFTMQQCVRLLCMFAHFQHPAPALWRALLPDTAAQHVDAACTSSSLPPRAVVQLLAASTSAGCSGDAVVLQGLLQLAVAVLQQHQGSLHVADLVQLVAAGSWLHSAVQQQVSSGGAAALQPLLVQLGRHLHQLLPRLVSAVLSQPHLLPPQHLPKLLQAAVQLHQSSSGNSGHAVSLNDSADLTSKHTNQQHHNHHSTQHVGQRQLQRLSDLAIEQLRLWQPAALVSLLHCHTQPPLYDPLLAEAYAEELVSKLGQASVQVLLQLLGVLVCASQQPGSYSHSQLLAVALRQLHGRLLLATEQQLQEAVVLLGQLQQQQGPVYRAAVRLLEGWTHAAAAGAAEQQGGGCGVRTR